MPHKATQNYQLSGWSTVTLYSEQEMADALKLSRDKLREAIESGKYGISYHGNPLNTFNREYTFLPSVYFENIKRWECVQRGGHHLEFLDYYDESAQKKRYQCSCGYTKYD